MSFLQKLFDQLTSLWERSDARSRTGFAVAAVTCIALVAGVGFWSSRPVYVYLASSLAPTETMEIVSSLETAGIAHKMNIAGSAVLVPRQSLNKARLAAGDYLSQNAVADAEIDNGFFGDPTLHDYHILRQRETSLARTIERLEAITSATVHIAQPDPSPFLVERAPTTANVTVQLKRGVPFAQRNAASIVKMVASSVQGLDPENVTLTDTSGNTLAAGISQGDADISNNFEYKRRLETYKEAQAYTMLASILGEGKAEVRVSADIDFTRTKKEATTYDPELKVRKTEDITNTTIKGGTKDSAGPAGLSSNTNTTRTGQRETPYSEVTETTNTEYENASTTEIMTEDPGRILRLTIAANVDLEPDAGADPATPKIEKADVESIIKNAVGFDETRDDQITVAVGPLAGPNLDDEQLIQTQTWEFYRELAHSSSLGLASVVALVLGLLTLRKIRPLTLPQTQAAEISAERLRVLSDLSQRARQNPEAMRAIVSSWLDQENDKDEDQPMKAAA